jgi:hypothetical protein
MLWDLLRNNDLTIPIVYTLFLQKLKEHQNQIEFPLSAKEMERAHIASSSGDEAKGMDIHLGVEGSKSNGHGEEIDKEGNVSNIIEGLKKYAQTC